MAPKVWQCWLVVEHLPSMFIPSTNKRNLAPINLKAFWKISLAFKRTPIVFSEFILENLVWASSVSLTFEPVKVADVFPIWKEVYFSQVYKS